MEDSSSTMGDAEWIRQSYELAKHDFGLVTLDEADSWDVLLDRLTNWVHHLLEKDFAQLLNILYRIDVDEAQVKQILELSEPDEMARDLGHLILERQKLKIKIRMKYATDR